MFTLFIFIVLYIATAGISLYYNHDDMDDILGNILGFLIVYLILFFITTLIIGRNIPDKMVSKTPIKEKIYSLNLMDHTQISGSFILGVGGFSSHNNIQYVMFKGIEGGKKIYRCSDYETVIYEDGDTDPYMVEYYHVVYDVSHIKLWSLKYNETGNYRDGTIRLHVPKNTIKVQYDLDLEKLK